MCIYIYNVCISRMYMFIYIYTYITGETALVLPSSWTIAAPVLPGSATHLPLSAGAAVGPPLSGGGCLAGRCSVTVDICWKYAVNIYIL